MADKIGAGWEGPGQTAFREFTVGGETVHARMVSLPPGDTLTIAGAVTANPPDVELTTVSSFCDDAGANSIVTAPAAGNRRMIRLLQLQLGVAGAQTVLVKSGATEIWNFIGDALGAGIMLEFAPGSELPCGAAEAINLDLASATVVRYVVRYFTEAV